ncbi:ScbR family autoregulator-binding transcription factor [Spirillospora sp. CA-294931]|uniref:ScbR family autoregulator-binding transcription factor n=1 Tax=Spirillospora sp. CA-294931 TaxID=3240042 RepID=UPI003D8B0C3A
MQERANRTRRLILQAAAEMFEARGYTGARLEDIVARPKVSKGALYFHFPSKEALASAVVDEYRCLWPSLIDELRPDFPRSMHLLFALSGRLAGRFREDALMRAGTRLAIERNLVSPSVRKLFRGWAGDLEDLLAEARDQGDLVAGADIESLAGFLVAALTGCQQVFATMDDDTDLQRCVRMMWWSVLPGLVEADRLTEMRALLLTGLTADPATGSPARG